MSYTIAEARDKLNEHITTAWMAAGLNASNLLFQDIKRDSNPDQDQVWARIMLKHGEARQSSLADSTGRTKFDRRPILMIQIFTPRNNGLIENDRVAQAILDAFEGQHVDCIWFRNTSSNEIGIDGSFYQTNVFTTVVYDQVK